MSVVQYGGITLAYPTAVNFQQDAVYDEVAGVDWYCTRFNVAVQSVLSMEYLSTIIPVTVVSSGSPAEIMEAVRQRLLKPRQAFSYKVGGNELIPQKVQGNRGPVDAQNGPKPQSCQISQLTSTTFLLTWSVVAHYWEKTLNPTTYALSDQNQPGSPVLYNRWSETVDIDGANYSTRTREGKYVIRSDNVEGFIADQVRHQMAVLSVPEGFLRDHASYTVSPDGLGISYRIVDKEVFKMPPEGAFKASGEYYESTTKHGAIRDGQVNVRLEGDKDTSQADLVKLAVGIATAKFIVGGAAGKVIGGPGNVLGANFAVMHQMSVRLGLYENWVDVALNVRMKPFVVHIKNEDGVIVRTTGPIYSNLTITPGSGDNTPPPAYRDRGTAELLIQAARYYDPSLKGVELGQAPITALSEDVDVGNVKVQLNKGIDVGRAGKAGE